MKPPCPRLIHLLVLAGTFFLYQFGFSQEVWNGSAGDRYWGTGGNWIGGVAPATGNNLVFNGTVSQNNSNNLSGLTLGYIAFNNSGFILNGNPLTLTPSTPGIFTNLTTGLSIISNNLTITTASKYWSIPTGSELRIAGIITNTTASGTSIGWLLLTNGGTVRIMNSAGSQRGMDMWQGTVIVDGSAALVNAIDDGFRFRPPTGAVADLVLTNNGTARIGGTGNFRMGNSQTTGNGTPAGPFSTSQVDMSSGTLELYGASVGLLVGDNVAGAKGVFNQNGGLVWGSGGANAVVIGGVANADGTYNLNGGTLWMAQVRQGSGSATNVIFDFNGGTLRPTGSSVAFISATNNVLKLNVQDGGAVIDTTNFAITIGAPLLAAGTGVGGLSKIGSGILTLAGTNAFTGNTLLSNGTLNVTGSLAGGGSVTVNSGATLAGSGSIQGPVSIQAGATLSPGTITGIPVTMSLKGALTIAGNMAILVNKSLTPSNDLVSVGGALSNTGMATLTVSNAGTLLMPGDTFKIFNRPLPGGNTVAIDSSVPQSGVAWTNNLAVNGTIGVISVPIVGTPADLASLTLSAGSLTPAFQSNIVTYTVSVPFTNTSVTVTPVSVDPAATILIIANGTTNAVASGAASGPILLYPGTNFIDVRVTSADTSLVKNYDLTMTRIRPNVLLILADDQGFSDWGCYGSEIQTPNLNSLASTGLRFRNFFNASMCSPTRCSLLTGLYTQQAGDDPAASLPMLRTNNNITTAELLGANGYHTYMAGKWHLGSGSGQAPEQRGFEEVFTFLSGSAGDEDSWDPTQYRFASTDGETTNIPYASTNFYQPDAIGDYSLQFLNSHFLRHTNTPFFLYMPFGAAHYPIEAPQSLVDSNVPIYAVGWDVLRYQRYTNMLAQGIIDSRYALSPNEGTAPLTIPAEGIPAWNTLSATRQADLARRMASYVTMIEKMDENIGRVIQNLQQNGQYNNTIIIALSDNGANTSGGVFGLTGNTPDPAPLTGTSLENMGLSGQPQIYVGGGWAHVSNTPFRWYKRWVHKGGIATPFIVHWPDGLTRTNQWEDETGHLIDVMATLVDITGVTVPATFNNHSVLPMQGMSLRPWFTNAQPDIARSIGWEHEANRAYISGTWKFVNKNFTTYDGSQPGYQLELYDMSTDPSETTNLANSNLPLLAQMITNWNNWCSYVGDDSYLLLNFYTNPPPIVDLDPVPLTNDLFVDTFNRPNGTNIDSSTNGMWGSFLPPLGAGATYYKGYQNYIGFGYNPAQPSIEIVSNALWANFNPATADVNVYSSENGIKCNFVGQEILNSGGFSVEMNVQGISSDADDPLNYYAGFGVGLTQAQAATGGDVSALLSPGAVAFRGEVGGNTGVSPFFVELDLLGNVKVWSYGALLDTIPVGQNSGTLTASFACAGFTTNDTVTVNVFFNGQIIDLNTGNTNSVSRTFRWAQNNANYIGLSARARDRVQIDNLAIRKLPLVNSLVTDYAMSYGLSGTNAAPNADPDGDGVNNFAEWAFGGDPATPDAYIASFRGIQVMPGNTFLFAFQRYKNYAAVGLQYQFFVSTNLATWTETTPTVISTDENEDKTDYEVVTMQLPSAATTNQSKLFLRIMAQSSD